MKKKEKLFIIGIILTAALLWIFLELFRSSDYGTIRIQVNGAEFGSYSLAEDQVISIGETNVCEIKNGKIKMTEATCPDHLCIRQGEIDASGGMIVCLPNKIVIEGVKTGTSDSSGTDIDIIS